MSLNRGRAETELKLRYSNHATKLMVNPDITDFGRSFLRKLASQIRLFPIQDL
jgi:hypothetical protein